MKGLLMGVVAFLVVLVATLGRLSGAPAAPLTWVDLTCAGVLGALVLWGMVSGSEDRPHG